MESLYNHAKEKFTFMVSVFSERAFDLIDKLDVCAWKVSSGEINNTTLINKMVKTKSNNCKHWHV